LQGKEYSRKGPTIRIRVNLQGMDPGIYPEINKWNLQGTVFAREGICKERN